MGQMLRNANIVCRQIHTIYTLMLGVTPKCQSELQPEMMLIIA